MVPSVSVIIPTYKRKEYLKRCLDGLLVQNYPVSAWEIIVVDDAHEYEIAVIIREYSSHTPVPITYIYNNVSAGPAAARNKGWQHAKSRVIAFTDDDCIPSPEWLREGIEVLEAKHYDGVNGKVQVPLPEKPTDYQKNIANLETAEFITANCFCLRNVLVKVKGFDERFSMAFREDSDLHFKLLKNNMRIGYAGKAIVVHPVRPAGFAKSLSEQKKSMYNALLYKKHKRLYKQRIQSVPPLNYYIQLFAFTGVLLSMSIHWLVFSAVCAGIWIIFTISNFLKRMNRLPVTLFNIADVFFTSLLIPPVSVFWRISGGIKYKVWFL